MTIPLGRELPPGSSNLPGGRTGRPVAALFGFAPGGACLARTVARPAGELLPHPFTLTADSKKGGGLLSVALARGHPRWELPSTMPCGARTFLPTPLASSDHPARPPIGRKPPPGTHCLKIMTITRPNGWSFSRGIVFGSGQAGQRAGRGQFDLRNLGPAVRATQRVFNPDR